MTIAKLLAEKPDYDEKPTDYMAWVEKLKEIDISTLDYFERERFEQCLLNASRVVQSVHLRRKVSVKVEYP